MDHFYVIGDIGGTNSRICLCVSKNLDHTQQPEIVFRKDFLNSSFESLSSIITRFFSILEKNHKPTWKQIEIGVFSLAGPVFDQKCIMTNLGWEISSSNLIEETPLSFVHIQNDFKSVGYGVLYLKPEQYLYINDAPEAKDNVIAVVGAGTGLGQCFVTFDKHGERYVHSSEGGHVDSPLTEEEDIEIMNYITKAIGLDKSQTGKHISTERIVSGDGLENLYKFFLAKENYERTLREFDDYQEKSFCLAPLVTKYAFMSLDKFKKNLDCDESQELDIFMNIQKICLRAVNKFLEIYALQVGNVGVSLFPKGGIFIAGGILAKIYSKCNDEQRREIVENFKKNYLRKGRMDKILKNIPVKMLLIEDAGLIGASYVGIRYMKKFFEGKRISNVD